MRPSPSLRRAAFPGRRGFSLIELLVVLGIIGILAALTVPAFKGVGRGNSRTAAERQLMADMSLARQQALRNRATVYMVFVPPRTASIPMATPGQPRDKTYRRYYEEHWNELQRLVSQLNGNADLRDLSERLLRSYTNAVAGQYTSYALYTERAVGDQPGSGRPRYLTEWRSLPDGVVLPESLFADPLFGPRQASSPALAETVFTNRFALHTREFPFPTTFDRGIYGPPMVLHYLAFEPDGQVRYPGAGARSEDFYLAVAEGSLMLARQADGTLDLSAEPDVIETPQRNHTNSFIRVAALTGRARLEKPRPR